jgi:hypothetical protein
MPRASACAAACLVIALATPARAQPPPQERALATVLFKEGKELMDRGETAKACEKFAESQRLEPAGGTILNLAVCHERLGRTATAWAEFDQALAMARRAGNDKRVALAEEHLRALRPRLSHVTIRVKDAEPTLRIELDGAPIGRVAWNTRVPVDPGSHEVAAVADKKKRWSARIDVPGDARDESIEVPALEAAPEPPPPPVTFVRVPTIVRVEQPRAPAASPRRQWGVAVTGLGVALTAAGVFLGLHTLDLQSESDARCAGGRCTSEGARLMDRAYTFADLSTGAFVLGAVAAGVGIYLIATGKGAIAF